MTKKQLLKELVSYAGKSNLTVEHCVHLYLQLIASENFDLKNLFGVELYDFDNPTYCIHVKLIYKRFDDKLQIYLADTTTIETCVLDNLNEEYLKQCQLLHKYETKYGNNTY